FIGLLISAFCALGVASSPSMIHAILGNQLVFWGMLIAMLVMAFVIPARAMSMSSTTVFGLFCLFSALMGAYLAPIFLVYKLGTITSTFFITAGTFGAMSVYGYFTKRDLGKLGTYLIMALFGLIILCIVNIFMKSTTTQWIITIVGLLIFVGLTAYDTQYVRRISQSNLDPAVSDRLATLGAMNLYLDFINMFLFILRIMGASRD
ncbi:MAG: Bax inhibitor-1/YccA family protein, partial [Muribaculaceae bacterium]|nr:Bax inhibitor-1/YccA family protein [Muribaculaceae bacterium]